VRRLSGVLGICAPVFATAAILLAGLVTPAYDPAMKTISRLAEPGLPSAAVVGLAIFAVGLAMVGLAVAMGPKAMAGRVLLGIAGAALLVAAAIPLNPASSQGTTIHRSATTIAMFTLVAALLAFAPSLRTREGWRGYGLLSFALGASAIGMLLIGLAMLPTTFAVGAWERCFLALPMTWMVLVSARLLRTSSTEPTSAPKSDNSRWHTSASTQETMKAAAANTISSRS
jgi:MFS family permease